MLARATFAARVLNVLQNKKKAAFLFSLDGTAWFWCLFGRDWHHLNITKAVNPLFSPYTSENGSTTTGFVLGVHPSLHATIGHFFFRMSTSAPPRCSFLVSLVALFLLMTFAASSSFPQKTDPAPSKSVVFSITALRVKGTLEVPFDVFCLATCAMSFHSFSCFSSSLINFLLTSPLFLRSCHHANHPAILFSSSF